MNTIYCVSMCRSVIWEHFPLEVYISLSNEIESILLSIVCCRYIFLKYFDDLLIQKWATDSKKIIWRLSKDDLRCYLFKNDLVTELFVQTSVITVIQLYKQRSTNRTFGCKSRRPFTTASHVCPNKECEKQLPRRVQIRKWAPANLVLNLHVVRPQKTFENSNCIAGL